MQFIKLLFFQLQQKYERECERRQSLDDNLRSMNTLERELQQARSDDLLVQKSRSIENDLLNTKTQLENAEAAIAEYEKDIQNYMVTPSRLQNMILK